MSSVGILIQHPSIDPQKITVELGITPTTIARSGEPVITPVGRKTGGHHKWSSWSYFDDDESKETSLRIDDLLEKIRNHRIFFRKVISEGGRAIFVIRSESGVHMHCEFDPSVLNLLASMSITIGFEVFPN